MSYTVRVERSGGGGVTVDRTATPVKVVSANNVGTLTATAQAAAAAAAVSAGAAAASALAASASAAAAASSASDAQAAQTAAEAAQGAAEAAQAAAVAAQGAAEAAASAASGSAGAAAASASAALASQGAAAASAASALAAQLAAQAAQAAAEAAAASITLPLPIGSGGTGQTSAAAALTALGGIAASLLTTRGDIIVRNATVPARLALGASGRVVQSDGTDAIYGTLTAGAFATGPGIVSPAMLDNGTGLSVLGVAGSSNGARADIVAANSAHVLMRNGSTIAFQQLITGSLGTNIVTDVKLRQSAGLSLIGRSANTTGNVADITASVDGTVMRLAGTAIGFGTLTAGAFATAPGIVTPAMLADGSALSVLGVTGNAGAARADIAASNDGEVLRRSGTAVAFGTVATAGIANDAVTYAKMQNVSATSRVLGRKTASAGDTEECTLSEVLDFIGSAARGDILYRGASAWARLAAGTAGNLLQTGGAAGDPSWLNASPIGKRNVWVDASQIIARTTGGAAAGQIETGTNRVNLKCWDFDAATTENVNFSMIAPKAWNQGAIGFQVVYTATNTGDVVWFYSAQSIRGANNDAVDGAFSSENAIVTTIGTANVLRTQGGTDITPAGTLGNNTLLVFRLRRDGSSGSDTLAVDARLVGVMLTFTLNAPNDT